MRRSGEETGEVQQQQAPEDGDPGAAGQGVPHGRATGHGVGCRLHHVGADEPESQAALPMPGTVPKDPNRKKNTVGSDL